MSYTRPTFIFCAVLSTACGDDDKGAVVRADSEVGQGDADGSETIGECCPIASAPSCNCFAIGGSPRDDGQCLRLCDAIPRGWTLTEDDNGCPVWIGGDPGSCIAPPIDTLDTGGGDTGDGDTTEPDTTPDAADSADSADAADSENPPEGPPRFERAGTIEIIEQYSPGFGGVAGTYFLIDISDGPGPMLYETQAAEGACKVWLRADATCGIGCQQDTICSAAGVCEPMRLSYPVGAMTIAVGDDDYTGTPGEFGYVFSPEPPSDGLFDPGEAITISAAGGIVPAFNAEVRGVADMSVQGVGIVELVDGVATTVTWTPANDGSTVKLVLQLGWHGAPPTGIIECSAPDAAGEIVVGPAVIAPFPYFSGLGLFQVPSYIERLTRAVVGTAGGPIEITASSRENLGITHNESVPE